MTESAGESARESKSQMWSTSSLAGASLPPLVLFRIAKKPNTRIATTAIPCRVRRLGVSQGTTKRCCIIEPPVSPWRRAGREFYSTVPNSLLEIGGCARDTCWDGRACLGVTHSSQASAEHFQQCAEFLPLRNRPAGLPAFGPRSAPPGCLKLHGLLVLLSAFIAEARNLPPVS